MRWFGRIWGLLWPARATFVELEHLQARLVRSLAYLSVAITAILLLRDQVYAGFPRQPTFVFSALLGAALLVLALRPAWSPWVLRVTLGCSLAVIGWGALSWGSAVAPSLYYLVLFPLAGTMLDAPGTGHVVTLACLGLLIVLRQKFGLLDPQAQMLWPHLCANVALAQCISLAFYHVFVGVQSQLNAQAQLLAQADAQRRRLVGALFEGLQAPVQSLAQAAQRPLAEGGAHLRDQVRAVADQLQGAASLRRDSDLADAEVAERRDRRLQRERQRFRAFTAALLCLYWGVVMGSIWARGPQGVLATLPYLPNLVLAAALLSGFRAALLVGAVAAALLLFLGAVTEPSFVEAVSLGNLLLTVVMMTAICREVWSLHAQLLRQLQEQTAALAEALRQGRRLLGTLFHDINNPLMAIQGILQLPQVGVPLVPQDQQRVQHMADRLQQLVGAAATFYLVDSPVPLGSLVPVEVGQLFADTQELFEDRLYDKQQRLSFSAPPGLTVLGLPQVLRDSVLSNLVSNALKFSPVKAQLVLEARFLGDEVALIVRDTGPGIPPDVLEQLAKGSAVSSRPGTAGEPGQGLGLGLVQEHLQRLGGRLELQRLAGGGTEARVWLKKA